MPFKSESQRRYMYARHPGIAKQWQKHTPKDKKLPEKAAAYHLGYLLGKKSAELKAKPEVNYRAGSEERNCGNCQYFGGEGKDCARVNGPISASKDCDLWKA